MEAKRIFWISTLLIPLQIIGSFALRCHDVLQTYEQGNILPTGYLNVSGYTLHPDYYESHNNSHYRACLCSATDCIRKCCPIGQAMGATRECVPNDITFSMDVYNSSYAKIHNDIKNNFRIVHGRTCQQQYQLDPANYPEDEYFLMENGHLHAPKRSDLSQKPLQVDDFCVDNLLSPENEPEEKLVIVCHYEPVPEESNVWMIISIPFLLLTLAVYWYLPERRTLHEKCLMCHVLALTVGYTFVVVMRFSSKNRNPVLCKISGYTIQLSFLGTFFWLNVMSFDIWATFRYMSRQTRSMDLSPEVEGVGVVPAEDEDEQLLDEAQELSLAADRGLNESLRSRGASKTFYIYCIYACGCPFIITAVGLCMDLLPNLPDYVIRPKFGVGHCWFASDAAIHAYFYGPIAILLVINVTFYISTAVKIYGDKRELRTKLAANEDSRVFINNNRQDHHQQHRYTLYLKLFLVMGVNWTLEVLSWEMGNPAGLFLLSDIWNSLQGVFIFIICVCQPRIFRLLKSKWNRSTPGEGNTVRSSASSRTTSFINSNILGPSRKTSVQSTTKL